MGVVADLAVRVGDPEPWGEPVAEQVQSLPVQAQRIVDPQLTLGPQGGAGISAGLVAQVCAERGGLPGVGVVGGEPR